MLKSNEIKITAENAKSLRKSTDVIFRKLAPVTDKSGFGYSLEDNFNIFTLEPHRYNISGFVWYKTKRCDRSELDMERGYYKPIHRNTTIEEFKKLNNRDIRLAFFFPENILKFLEQEKGLIDFKIIAYVEENRKFYPSDESTKSDGLVFKISIEHTDIEDSIEFRWKNKDKKVEIEKLFIPIFFENDLKNSVCKFWDEKQNNWDMIGITADVASCLLYCETDHLTAFTRIIDSHHLIDSSICKPVADQEILSTITKICLVLSGISITGLFVVATLLKKFRKRTDGQIFLQLNFSTLLQIVIFFVNTEFDICNATFCIAIGSLLQYCIIAQVTWMCLYTVYHFMKTYNPFINIGESPNSRIVNTMTFIGWGAPCIPTLLSLYFGMEHYDYVDVSGSFCFPSDDIKLYGFVLVVFAIILINLFIYLLSGVKQMKNLLYRKREFRSKNVVDHDGNQLKNFMRQSAILLIIIGVPWIFGGLHIINSTFEKYSSFSTYLFCIVVPLQGFLLFIGMFVCNKNFREALKNLGKKPHVTSQRTDWSELPCMEEYSVRYQRENM